MCIHLYAICEGCPGLVNYVMIKITFDKERINEKSKKDVFNFSSKRNTRAPLILDMYIIWRSFVNRLKAFTTIDKM